MDTTVAGACVVGRIEVRDAEAWAEYCRLVPSTLTAWNATVVARGSGALASTGAAFESDMVVIRFPDLDAIEGRYRSAAYQALIPLRDQAADVVIVGYRV